MQAERIINAIESRLRALDCYPRLRDPDTRAVSLSDTPVNPSNVIANELSSRTGRPPRNRQFDRDEILDWRFSALVRFDEEVSMWSAEESLRTDPIVLAHDTDNGLPFVRVRLVSSDYSHPVTGQPESGTSVRMVFEAAQSPQ